MFSVFSNYLDPFIDKGLLQDVDQTKPSEVYELLRIAYNQGASGVINTTRFFIPHYEDDEYDYDLLYEVWRNKDLQDVITWFNSKVIPVFTTVDYRRKHVVKRIALSKLNKLVEEGKLPHEVGVKLGLNLIETLENEQNLLTDEDLPFLG